MGAGDGIRAAIAAALGTALSCTASLKSGDATFESTKVSDSGGADVRGDRDSGNRDGRAIRDSGVSETGVFRDASDGGGRAVGPKFEFEAYLKAPRPQSSAWFGYYTAVDPAGTGIAATSPLEDVQTEAGTAVDSGRAYLFEKRNGVWRTTPLTAPNAGANDGVVPGSTFPNGVPALSIWGAMTIALDLDAVAVGVTGEDSGSSNMFDDSAPEAGAVYVYDRHDLVAPPYYLKAPKPQPGALFGSALVVSGSKLFVGAPQDGGTGTVFIYDHQNGRFSSPIAVKSPLPYTGDLFGTSIAVSGDLMAVGAATEDGSSTGYDGTMTQKTASATGAVYTFRNGTSGWQFEHYLKANLVADGSFLGFGVAIAGDDVLASAVGAGKCDPDPLVSSTGLRGALYAFSEKPGQSKPTCMLPDSGGLEVLYAFSIRATSRYLVVGAPWDLSGTNDPKNASKGASGAAYVYEHDAATSSWKELEYLKAPNADANDVFGNGVAITDGLIVVGAPREWGGQSGPNADMSDNSVKEAGALYVFRQQTPRDTAGD